MGERSLRLYVEIDGSDHLADAALVAKNRTQAATIAVATIVKTCIIRFRFLSKLCFLADRLTIWVFHPLWTKACRLLYLVTVKT